MQRGNFGQGHVALDECLSLARELGQASAIAQSLFYLGHLTYAQGDAERAGELWEEGLHLLRPKEDPLQYARLLVRLSVVALNQADYESARAQLAESLTLLRELGGQLVSVQASRPVRVWRQRQERAREWAAGSCASGAALRGDGSDREQWTYPILSEERLSTRWSCHAARSHRR